MQTSNEIEKVSAAVVKAQGEMGHAIKGSENPAFKREGSAMKYADLTAVWDAAGPVLKANDLAALQDVVNTDTGMGVRTRLLHASGQWIEFDPPIITLSKKDAHGAGSVLTYGRRYSLSAALGIVADVDDDGNAAVAPANTQEHMERVVAKQTPPQSSPVPLAPWHGPLKITALKAKLRAFSADLKSCTDGDQLSSLVGSEFETLRQCSLDLPQWWSSQDGAAREAILAKAAELKEDLTKWIASVEKPLPQVAE